MLIGGRSSPPKFSKLYESWSKVSHAAREMVTVFSDTFFSNSSWSNDQSAAPLHWKGVGASLKIDAIYSEAESRKKLNLPPAAYSVCKTFLIIQHRYEVYHVVPPFYPCQMALFPCTRILLKPGFCTKLMSLPQTGIN